MLVTQKAQAQKAIKSTPLVTTGKRKGSEPPAQPPAKRKRISDIEMVGEVLEWSGSVGWIAPQDEIEHPLAKKNGGKVKVLAKDLVGETKELKDGQLVQFHIYADGACLGAEECVALDLGLLKERTELLAQCSRRRLFQVLEDRVGEVVLERHADVVHEALRRDVPVGLE